MRQTDLRILLAAAAAVIVTSATAAAPQDSERSYLPPQSSGAQEATKNVGTTSQETRRPPRKTRTRTRNRHVAEGFEGGPPDMFALPGVFFFPFF